MIFGDIIGMNSVYTPSGQPILNLRERIISYRYIQFSAGNVNWRPDGDQALYHGWVFRTNYRLIGIRKPNKQKATWMYTSLQGVYAYAKETNRMNKMVRAGAFECFSLDFKEINKIKEHKIMNIVTIIIQENLNNTTSVVDFFPIREFKTLFENYEEFKKEVLVRDRNRSPINVIEEETI